jgi:hypothetical protein
MEDIRETILDMRELRTIIGGMTNNITESAWRNRLRWLRRIWSCFGCLFFGAFF